MQIVTGGWGSDMLELDSKNEVMVRSLRPEGLFS